MWIMEHGRPRESRPAALVALSGRGYFLAVPDPLGLVMPPPPQRMVSMSPPCRVSCLPHDHRSRMDLSWLYLT